MSNFTSDLKDIWRLVYPYFLRRTPGEISLWFIGPVRAPENVIGFCLLGGVIAFEIGFTVILKMVNTWQADFFNSIQEKKFQDFIYLLLYFVVLAAVYVAVAVQKAYINQLLQVRWRKSMTEHFVGRWLGPAQHYRMRMISGPADNPDQRISEDVHTFVGSTMVLGIGFFGNLMRLFTFLFVLWQLSEAFPMTSFGAPFNVPGYLIIIAAAYAAVGTFFTHLIGRPLVGLQFSKERYEANFRFAMARVRENGEQIALLGGEEAERAALHERFGSVLANVYAVIRRQRKLNIFTYSFSNLSTVFPFLMLGPAYFFGKATLGSLMQTRGAFDSVLDGLTWFVDNYTNLADYRATVQRLTGFEAAMKLTDQASVSPPHIERQAAGKVFAARDLVVSLPEGRPLSAAPGLVFEAGDRVLLSGISGSGKTTLLRAFSGIWPFGKGRVDVPPGTCVLVLPQRTYLPQGTLRQALTYPRLPDAYPDTDVRSALAAVGLGHLAAELDEAANWMFRLSGGEQQRLGVARALLAKPDWLFLDEATAALDSGGERELYEVLLDRLPKTAIVSIAHRDTLDDLHNRRIEMRRSAGGLFQATEAVARAAE